jgi:thiol-disulfide isomerase/thioredoxin
MNDADASSAFAASSAADRERLAPPPPRLRLWLWLGLLAIVSALFVWRMLSPPAEAANNGRRHPAVGKTFTQVVLEPLTGDGQPISPATLEGKVTLINFWATWCGPCRMEFPGLVELHEHFRNERDFQLLSINCDDEGPLLKEKIAEFLKAQGTTLRTYQDSGGQTAQALTVAANLPGFALPTTVLIGRDGVIRALWIGYNPSDEPRVREAIDAALRNDPLPDTNPKH